MTTPAAEAFGTARRFSPRDADEALGLTLRWHGTDTADVSRSWLVRDLVFETGTGLLAGQWGTAKTFIALDLSAAVMLGGVFAGQRVQRQGGVLFIAPEGAFEIPLRLRGLCGAREMAPTERLPFAWIDECPRLLDPPAVPILIATCRAAARHMREAFGVELALIIIDTIAAGARFDDENSAAEAQRVVSAMNDLSRATGAFVLGVDHFGKAVETGTRGSSGKDAGVDVVLASLGDRDLAGNVSNTRLAVRKLRGGRTGVEYPYALKVVEVGRDRDMEAITTCVVDWRPDRRAEGPKDRWPVSLKVFRAAMTAALAEHGAPDHPFGDSGPIVVSVAESAIRSEFALAYPADGETAAKKAEAKKKAFQRAMRAARDRDLVVSREVAGVDRLWFRHEGD